MVVGMFEYVVYFGARDGCPANFVEDQGGVASDESTFKDPPGRH